MLIEKIYIYIYFDIRLETRRTDVDKFPVFLIRICVKGNCTRMFYVRENEREKVREGERERSF